MYDAVTVVPHHAQDVRVARSQQANLANIPWNEWLQGRVAQNLSQKATHMAAIQLALHSLHTRGRADQAPIDVSIDLTTKRKFVKSSEDLPKGTVALPPCVPHAFSRVRQEYSPTPRAHRSDTEVRSGGRESRDT